MKTFWIIVSALLTTAFMFLGKEVNPDFYLAATAAGWLFFRLAVGNDCPAVWLMSKLGVKGLACPSDHKK